MSAAISKMDALLETQLLPHFEGWTLWPHHCAIVRQTPDLVQAVLLDMPRPKEGAYVCHAVYPLALQMHDEDLPITLGGRVSRDDGGVLYLNFPLQPDGVAGLVSLIKNQLMPPADRPLSLNETSRTIESQHVKRDLLMPYWGLGILNGLMNEMETGRRWFQRALDWLAGDFAQRSQKGIRILPHLTQWKADIEQMMELTATPDRFNERCRTLAQNARKALHLPETQ